MTVGDKIDAALAILALLSLPFLWRWIGPIDEPSDWIGYDDAGHVYDDFARELHDWPVLDHEPDEEVAA